MAKITNVSQLIAQFGGGVKSPISPKQEKPAAKAAAIAKSKLQAPVAQPKAQTQTPAIKQVPVKGSEKMRAAPKPETPQIPSPPAKAVAPSVRTTSKQIKGIQGKLAEQPKAELLPVPTPATKKPLSPPAKKAPPRPQQSAAEALAQAKRVEQDKAQPRVAPKTAAPPRPLPARPKATPEQLKLHRMFREASSKAEIEAGEEFARILSEDAQKTDVLDALLLTVITTPKETSQTLIDTIKQKYPTVVPLMNKRFEEFVGQLEENIPNMPHDERKELLEKIMALPKGPEKEILLGAIARASARETIFMAIDPKVLKESQDIEPSPEEKQKKSERAKHAASDLAGPGRKIAEAVFKEIESDFSEGLLPQGQKVAFLKLKGEWEDACKKNAETLTNKKMPPRVAPKTAAPPRPLPARPKATPEQLKLHRMFREASSKAEIEAGEEFARILSEDAQKTDVLDALLLTVITTPKETSQTLIDTIKQKYPTVVPLMNKRFEEFVGQLEENIPNMPHDERKELLEKIMALPKGPEKEILLGAIARASARETIFMAIDPKVLKESQDIESSPEEKQKKSERAKHAASDLAGPGRKIAEAVFKEIESDFSEGLLPQEQKAAFLKLKGEWEAACKKNAETPTAEG